jgi:hypothetical protein
MRTFSFRYTNGFDELRVEDEERFQTEREALEYARRRAAEIMANWDEEEEAPDWSFWFVEIKDDQGGETAEPFVSVPQEE